MLTTPSPNPPPAPEPATTPGGKALARARVFAATAVLLIVVFGAIAWLGSQSKREYVRHGKAQREAILASRAPPPVETPKFLNVDARDARLFNASIPLAVSQPVAARPFRFEGDETARQRAVDCLAATALYEAGDRPGWETAVIQTVINRSRHTAFPSSICEVVFQGSERRTGCQFTFTCDGALRRTPSPAALDRARRLAIEALDGKVDARVGNATHYHADYVVPYWSASLDKVAVVGPHIFYRWPGRWGTPAAFGRAAATGEPAIAKMAFLSAIHRAEPASAETAELVADAPVTGPTPLPEPPVGEAAMRGSILQQVSASRDTYLLHLDRDAFAGDYAMTALALCKTKRTCRVLGWRDPAQVASGLPLQPSAAEALSFAYVKNMRRGEERALWNCQQIDGRSASQCLPASAADVAELLRVD